MVARNEQVMQVLAVVTEWSELRSVRGLALVGSYARGQARPDSDIDLVLLVNEPNLFRTDTAWLAELDWRSAYARPLTHRDAEYGAVWSRHVQLDDGLEIEFGFALPSWADVAPVDAGTRRVMMDGCRILYDPDGILSALRAVVRGDRLTNENGDSSSSACHGWARSAGGLVVQ
jgi:predicted nucleotidyltransferase